MESVCEDGESEREQTKHNELEYKLSLTTNDKGSHQTSVLTLPNSLSFFFSFAHYSALMSSWFLVDTHYTVVTFIFFHIDYALSFFIPSFVLPILILPSTVIFPTFLFFSSFLIWEHFLKIYFDIDISFLII